MTSQDVHDMDQWRTMIRLKIADLRRDGKSKVDVGRGVGALVGFTIAALVEDKAERIKLADKVGPILQELIGQVPR